MADAEGVLNVRLTSTLVTDGIEVAQGSLPSGDYLAVLMSTEKWAPDGRRLRRILNSGLDERPDAEPGELDLYLAKAAAATHHGTIAVETDTEKPVTLCVYLPPAPPA